MGTYRQPSQIIDQRLNHFRKNFKEGLERQAKKDKLELSQLEKLKKAEEDFNRKVLEQMKKRRMQGERPNRN